MKKVKYYCDLCKEKKEANDLTALYYKSDVIPQRYVLDKDKLNETDKHVCNDCIDLIQKENKIALQIPENGNLKVMQEGKY